MLAVECHGDGGCEGLSILLAPFIHNLSEVVRHPLCAYGKKVATLG